MKIIILFVPFLFAGCQFSAGYQGEKWSLCVEGEKIKEAPGGAIIDPSGNETGSLYPVAQNDD